MKNKLISGLVATAVLLAPAAALAAHGRAGLWSISTTMDMPNMPQMSNLPPEAMAMMKSRGMSMPGMGAPIVTQICMTQEEVNADRIPSMNEQNCTTKILSQTPNAMTAETTCHGRMEGVGRMQMAWRGNDHYEGTYSFKGSMQGRPHEMTSRYTGDFVRADCGSVKPNMPKAGMPKPGN